MFDPEFPEVPSDFLRSDLWTDCGSGAWGQAENIFVLESRALANCVRDLALSGTTYHKRFLFLGDNLGVTLAFARSRSKNFVVLVLIRKTAAYQLAGDFDV